MKKGFTIKIYNGFTLIELMITVSIISFLVLIATIFLRTQIFKSYDAKRKAEVKRIGIAVEEYEKDKDCYPPPALVKCESGGTGLRPYLDTIPCDPVSKESYAYQNDGSSCSKWYILYSKLQNEKDGDYTANIGPNGGYSFYYASPNAPAVTSTIPSNPNCNFVGCKSGSCVDVCDASGVPMCTANYNKGMGCSPCTDQTGPINECN